MNQQKGFSTSIVIGLVAVLVFLGGLIYLVSDRSGEKAVPANYQDEQMTEKTDEAMMEKEDGAMMEKEEKEMMEEMMEPKAMEGGFSGEILTGTKSPLLDFKNEDFEKALREKPLVVLYFYANWCPICRAEFPKMQSAFNKLQSDQVVGFRVNYNDNQTDNFERQLARQHGVSYQHTKVILKNGERVLKSPETWEESRYLSEINSRLN